MTAITAAMQKILEIPLINLRVSKEGGGNNLFMALLCTKSGLSNCTSSENQLKFIRSMNR